MIALPVPAVPAMRATGARLLAAARRPRFVLRNLRYHVGLEPSPEEHVFVLGPPRSGTTLVMRLLSSHSSVTSIDAETNFFMRWNLLEYQMLPGRSLNALANGARTSIELFDRIASHERTLAGAKYFLEKTPEYALRLSFLRTNFPRSKFIFVVRDGRDGFLSALRNSSLRIRTIREYASLWKRCVTSRLRHRDMKTMMDVRYEDLCADPASVLRSTMSFLGEELEAGQLAPARYGKTTIKQKDGHQRLSSPISSATVGEWRTRLTAAEVALFTAIAGRELSSMGYDA